MSRPHADPLPRLLRRLGAPRPLLRLYLAFARELLLFLRHPPVYLALHSSFSLLASDFAEALVRKWSRRGLSEKLLRRIAAAIEGPKLPPFSGRKV